MAKRKRNRPGMEKRKHELTEELRQERAIVKVVKSELREQLEEELRTSDEFLLQIQEERKVQLLNELETINN